MEIEGVEANPGNVGQVLAIDKEGHLMWVEMPIDPKKESVLYWPQSASESLFYGARYEKIQS
jgi:hypothetical protein